MSKIGMNVLYDESKIGRFNYKRFSPEDRIRIRKCGCPKKKLR
ncbi:hypothetical protein ACFL4Z_04020 [candidate division KSB1 bacterium]